MSTTETAARGVRLPVDTWRRIDAAAEELGMRPNEYLRRRIMGMIQRDADVQKENTKVNEELEWVP